MFREPKHPILIETDDGVKGATNKSNLNKIVSKSSFSSKHTFTVVDSTGEGWEYYIESNLITPLCVNKRWTKKGIIELYNAAISNNVSEPYICKSPSAKRFDKILKEIVDHAIRP